MRLHQKKMILQLLATIEEAIGEIEKQLIIRNYENVWSLLCDCQDGIISIGETIEKLEGKKLPVISQMEEFCENLYQMSTLLDGNNSNAHRMEKILKKQLLHIIFKVRDQLTVRREIVFLPYKAAMWDSLESIWIAAKEDQNCDVYVMPIPYFERIAESNKFTEHYEGDLLPSYVDITSYMEYNLEARRPDVIYFHNPYDNFNFVTSVHPRFYSAELKKYTDMLIYVPYYVTGGSMSEGLKNLQAYSYADRLIIQSSKLEKYYMDIVEDNKIVPLGSPKVDRVLKFDKNKPEIHENWKAVIGNRKVILYNTSISGLLKYGMKALEKMQYVFSNFKDRKDVTIIWREHPLSEATLRAMNPQLLLAYNETKEYFIDNNIGILDVTSDVTLAVAISDAYIGEETSSLVHLFGVAGKPVFLIDMDIKKSPSKEEFLAACFCDYVVNGDKLWFVHTYLNILCRMDIHSGKTKIVGKIPKEDFEAVRLYNDILEVDNKLILAPTSATQICEYDLNTNSFIKTSIPNPTVSNFVRMIQYEKSIFMVPTFYLAVGRYDLETRKFECNTKSIDKLKEYVDDSTNYKFMFGVCVRDNLLLMASAQANIVLEMNMETDESKVYEVGEKGNTYWGMTFDGKDYWMIPHESDAIVRWNYETGKVIEYRDYPVNFVGGSNYFISIVFCGSYLLAFPKTANMIVKIDIKTGKMFEFKLNIHYKEGKRKFKYNQWGSNYYFAKKYDDNHVMAMSAYDNSLLMINTVTEECIVTKCIIDNWEEFIDDTIQREFAYQGDNLPFAARESGVTFTLNRFIDYVLCNVHDKRKQQEAYARVINNMDGTCGEKIHQYIMTQLNALI